MDGLVDIPCLCGPRSRDGSLESFSHSQLVPIQKLVARFGEPIRTPDPGVIGCGELRLQLPDSTSRSESASEELRAYRFLQDTEDGVSPLSCPSGPPPPPCHAQPAVPS